MCFKPGELARRSHTRPSSEGRATSAGFLCPARWFQTIICRWPKKLPATLAARLLTSGCDVRSWPEHHPKESQGGSETSCDVTKRSVFVFISSKKDLPFAYIPHPALRVNLKYQSRKIMGAESETLDHWSPQTLPANQECHQNSRHESESVCT